MAKRETADQEMHLIASVKYSHQTEIQIIEAILCFMKTGGIKNCIKYKDPKPGCICQEVQTWLKIQLSISTFQYSVKPSYKLKMTVMTI